MPAVDEEVDARHAVAAWAASGAMALTGPETGPGLGPPAPLVGRLAAVADLLADRSERLGRRVAVDPLRLLTERAAIAGLHRRGRTSCGGGTRLVPAGDGWLAVNLARPDDVDLVPAWTGSAASATRDVWRAVDVAARRTAARDLAAWGAELGLPVAALPDRPPDPPRAGAPLARLPVATTRLGGDAPTERLEGAVVVDLGSLWAGPLCGALLADAGARVIKVESATRPDGARRGPGAFFDLLNAGKQSVAVDLGEPDGRELLRDLVAAADVVIEASRPRALEQLGVDATALVTSGRPRAWVSITGHGRDPGGRDRVGFGDDAAVAGGLVAWNGDEPCFCADAVADPAAGLVAAAAVLDALTAGSSWLLDVSMAGVAAALAGPTLPVPDGVEPGPLPPPRHRGVGPALGADRARVLRDLDLDR